MMRLNGLLLSLALLAGPASSLSAQQTFDTVIRNARVLDGTGNPWYYTIGKKEDVNYDLNKARHLNETKIYQ